MKNDIHDQLASYYIKSLSTTIDLKTTVCCTTESYPGYIKHILSEISDKTVDMIDELINSMKAVSCC